MQNPFMSTDTFCNDIFYVHTDPGSLPSFAEECSFGNCLRIHTTKKKQDAWNEGKTLSSTGRESQHYAIACYERVRRARETQQNNLALCTSILLLVINIFKLPKSLTNVYRWANLAAW